MKQNFLLFSFIVLLLSCGKDQEIDQVSDNPYDVFLNTPDNGFMQFANSGGVTETEYIPWNVIASSFDNIKDRNPVSSDFYLNDICLTTPVNDYQLKDDIEGTNVKVAFKQKDAVCTFYIPQNVKLLSPTVSKTSDNEINTSTILKWEPDPLNIFPLRITITDEDTNKSNIVDVLDNGKYQLDASLFKGISSNARLSIYIERHNYLIVEKNNEKYSLWAYSLRSYKGKFIDN